MCYYAFSNQTNITFHKEEKVKKIIAMFMVLALLTPVLASCGSSKYDDNFVGNWKLVGVETGGEYYDEDMIDLLSSLGMTFSLVLESNKRGTLELAGEKLACTWKAKDANTVTIKSRDSVDAKLVNGRLTIEVDGDKLIFQKR